MTGVCKNCEGKGYIPAGSEHGMSDDCGAGYPCADCDGDKLDINIFERNVMRACKGAVITLAHPSGKAEDGSCTIMPSSLEVDGVWVTPRHLVDRFAQQVNSIKRDYAEKEARMEKVVATIGGLSADIDRLAEYNRIVADKNEALEIECRRLKGKYPGWYALNEAMPELLDAPETVISGNRRSNPVACIAPGRYWVGCLIEDRTSNKTTRVIWGRIHKGSLEYIHDRAMWPTHWSVIPV